MPITIFRTPHSPKALNKIFEKRFEECDIFLTEQGFNDGYNEIKEYLSELSNKGYSSKPLQFFGAHFDEYGEKLKSFIKNSKKQIEVEKSPFTLEDYERVESLADSAEDKFCKGDLEIACAKMVEYLVEVNERDKGRMESLSEQLINLQKENKNKRILAEGGSDHLIHYKLKEKGLDVKQEFPYKPLILPIHTEVKRRIAFNKPFTMESVAKSIVEYFIIQYLMGIGSTPKQIIEKPRKILEKLSYNEIRDLSKYISENSLRRQMPSEAIILWLKNKGFEI